MERSDGGVDRATWSIDTKESADTKGSTRTSSIPATAEDKNLFKFALIHAGTKPVMKPCQGVDVKSSRQNILKTMEAFKKAEVLLELVKKIENCLLHLMSLALKKNCMKFCLIKVINTTKNL